MSYVDGFVLIVSKKKIKAYKALAVKASKVWMEHGAVGYHECVGEDLKIKFGVPFPKLAKAKAGETVVFAYITYRNRKHRDRVNKKVMVDPRVAEMCDPKNPPFDMKRMSMGGFETLVEA